MGRTARELGAVFAAACTVVLVLFVVGLVGYEIVGRLLGPLLYSTVTAAALAVASVAVWWLIRRRFRLPAFSGATTIALFVAYGVTWALGAPAVHTVLAASEVAQYKKLKAEGDGRVWDAHPNIQFFVSLPVAPALILTYHEYQISGLWGEGAWELHAWYFSGTQKLARMGTWIS